jgi:hypothetical protein
MPIVPDDACISCERMAVMQGRSWCPRRAVLRPAYSRRKEGSKLFGQEAGTASRAASPAWQRQLKVATKVQLLGPCVATTRWVRTGTSRRAGRIGIPDAGGRFAGPQRWDGGFGFLNSRLQMLVERVGDMLCLPKVRERGSYR